MGGGFDQFTLRFRLGGRYSSIDNIASGQSKDFKGRERREGREGKERNGKVESANWKLGIENTVMRAYAKEVAGCNVKL
ncbi:uncharacterized protein EAE98_001272 [Botrytis deweyae]|uniref:Uncharacterized protein n=1 Tax=Botrytis deweyae TaxID=2478750 RepID=A0ABQ7J114_9HELO|nr:uncharacterized protein EAE98_001272 [Botrytis deweyae]KAF7938935.1 hypothetical protein EAE98_001272 [Botrytis deweyae]